MSDEVPLGRLSQIFESLTNLHDQQQQLQPSQSQRSNASSSPSPCNSGRVTPASGSVGGNFQQLHYFGHSYNYYVRTQQDGTAVPGPPYQLHTFPSASSQAHRFGGAANNSHSAAAYHQYQQQLHSLPPSYAVATAASHTSQSLNSSPLLSKRACSFSGNLSQSALQANANAAFLRAAQHQAASAAAAAAGISQSTPNSPRLMPRRTAHPPPIPAKPNANLLLSNLSKTHEQQPLKAVDKSSVAPPAANSGLAALDKDAPWPPFSLLTEHLDVHQVNNYAQQGLPEVSRK